MEIPNPNHFGSEGRTGGPINAVNSNLLNTSDFFTGAFAPEYGNATSGVFDMKLRNGNNRRHERSIGIGALGVDATFEGPFSKNSQASYLANYRYSTLALLDLVSAADFNGIPKYQDATFKVNLPTKKAGTFSLFGLGGISSIQQQMRDSSDVLFVDAKYKANVGVVGLKHLYQLSSKSYLISSLSANTNGNAGEFWFDAGEGLALTNIERMQRSEYRLASTYHHKIDHRNSLKAGAIYTINQYDFDVKYTDPARGELTEALKARGTADLAQAFVSWKHRFTADLSFTGGMHYMHFMLNNAVSAEPRLGMNWQRNAKQSFSIAYGLHSKLEPITLYFADVYQEDGSLTKPNRELRLGKAHHLVLGFNQSLSPLLHFKTELYYQYLHGVPVVNDPNSAFSMINSVGPFANREMINAGLGRNYGAEFTLERFFSRGFFFMNTLSVYQSEYQAMDQLWRNTAFNGNYITNVLAGKEFVRGKNDKKRTYGISGKLLYGGGSRYTPVDLAASIEKGAEVRDVNRIYGAQSDDLFMANMVFYTRKDRKRSSHEFRLDFQNISNHQSRLSDYYNPRTKSIEYARQLPIMPAFMYKIDF